MKITNIARNLILIILFLNSVILYSKDITSEKVITKNSKNKRKILVEHALSFNNTKGINTKKFRNDCSGFTRRVYDKLNIELFNIPRKEHIRPNGTYVNGVELIWKYVKRNGKIFKNKLPKIGDLIFFDNTHDRNKNKKLDDPFTHIGIVVKVENNTIHYIHKADNKIIISKLNANAKKLIKNKKNNFSRKNWNSAGLLVKGYGNLLDFTS